MYPTEFRLCVERASIRRSTNANEKRIKELATDGTIGKGLLLIVFALLRTAIYKIIKLEYTRY